MRKTKNSAVWNDAEKVKEAVKGSKTLSEILTKLGINLNSGNYQTLKAQALRYGIELPKYNPSECTRNAIRKNKLSLEDLFSNRGFKTSSDAIKKEMILHFGIKNECLECGQGPVWNGKPLTLELDHIDGNSFNNEITNLRILCGHCHSQTLNFRGRGKDGKIYSYCSCGKRISKNSLDCVKCSFEKKKEANRNNPRYVSLDLVYAQFLEKKTFVALGNHYNVSDNAVRKYIKLHGISIESFKKGELR